MKQRKFTVLNDSNEKLVCIEALPSTASITPLPVVILCHGFAYFKEEDGIFTGIAERLAGQGYAVYYFDFSGCGESEGDYAYATLTKLIGDLNSIRNEVTSYKYIDSTKVSLVGQSFGTNVVIAAQIKNLERIVLCGSFSDPGKVLGDHMEKYDDQGVAYKYHSSGRVTKINPTFWSDLKNYQLVDMITTIECPILFIHGLKDPVVPIENMSELLANARYAEEVILPNSDHGLEPERQQAFDAVAKFFAD